MAAIKEIHRADRRTLLLEVTANDGELPHGFEAERNEFHALQEGFEHAELMDRVGGIVRALVQFAVGDVTGCQALRS